MAVEGKIGEDGYEEFDSSDFEKEDLADETPSKVEKPAPKEKADHGDDEEPAKDDETPKGDDETSTEGDDGEGDKEVTATDDSKDPKTAAAASDATYTPNFKYKVLDQEKEFPAWAQGLIKDKETEDNVRDLITKGEGLETIKPRYQQAVQERDNARGESEGWKTRVNRLLHLRDTNHRLFFAELGVNDEMLVRAGREILEAKTDAEGNPNPARWAEYNRMRQAELDAFNANLSAQSAQQTAQQTQLQAHERAMDIALSRPDISTFSQRFDALHGQGAFRNAVMAHGSHVFTSTKQYVDPATAAEYVFNFHSKGMAPVTQPVVTPGAAPAGGAPAPKAAAAKPGALPNLGRGRNASPVAKRPRSIKEMREFNKREAAREAGG